MTSYAAPLTQMRRQQSLAQGNARDVARWLTEQGEAVTGSEGSISARHAARDGTIFDLLMGAAQFLRGSQ